MDISVYIAGKRWEHPRPNKDGSCFRCKGVGWVEICGSKANPPDDGMLWGVMHACWFCMYWREEWMGTFFDLANIGVAWPRTTPVEHAAQLAFQAAYRGLPRVAKPLARPVQMMLFG